MRPSDRSCPAASGKSCFFGVFDGHSGKRASQFARDQLGEKNHETFLAYSDALPAKYLEVDLQQLGPREVSEGRKKLE